MGVVHRLSKAISTDLQLCLALAELLVAHQVAAVDASLQRPFLVPIWAMALSALMIVCGLKLMQLLWIVVAPIQVESETVARDVALWCFFLGRYLTAVVEEKVEEWQLHVGYLAMLK